MKKQDLHTHTYFCDGKDSPEDMVCAAIEAGLDTIGICTHSYTDFDTEWCIPFERIGEFQAELSRLKAKYADKIEVLCGVEQDYLSETPTDGFDYVIGSVHYVTADGVSFTVDESPEAFKRNLDKYFGGDVYKLTEAYYACVAKVAERTKCDLIGHFDLVTKFNEVQPLIDTKDERYVKAYTAALDSLLKANVPFEVNTGAISRGYRTMPYPQTEMIEYIKAHGGKLMLSSDSHQKETVAYKFDEFEYLI